jgi:PBP superfamily domain
MPSPSSPLARLPTRPPAGLAPAPLSRRRVLHAALGAAFGLGLVARAHAQGESGRGGSFVVIVNRANGVAAVSRAFLSDAFLKKATHWDGGERIEPVDLRPDSFVRRAFSSSVLRRPVGASGGDLPPPELDSDDAVVRYVARYPGAIGYVSVSASLGETKALGSL